MLNLPNIVSLPGNEAPNTQQVYDELLGDFAKSRRIQQELKKRLFLEYNVKNCQKETIDAYVPLSLREARAIAKEATEGESIEVLKSGKTRVKSPAPRRKLKEEPSEESSDESEESSDDESDDDESDDETPVKPRRSRRKRK